MHLLSPMEAEGSPGLELNYGPAASPETIWFELPQVCGLGSPWDSGTCRTQTC